MNNKKQHNLPIKTLSLNFGGLTQITETQIQELITTEKMHITLLQEKNAKSTQSLKSKLLHKPDTQKSL
jgi:hypothetical protein